MLRGEKSGFFGLTEPSGGSDPARAIQTRAARDGDDWIINGGKIFISGADRADFGLVFARTDPDKGRNGVTCFIVDTDTPGFHVRRVVHTLRSARYATELQFEDMRVPHANVLGAVNGGFAIANDRLSRQRIPYAAGCIGVAIKAHELALEYAPQRQTFGAPLSSRQAIQWMLVDNEIDIRQARWLTLEAAARAQRGDAFRKEAAMAKLVATEAGGGWWIAACRFSAATESPRTSPSSAGIGRCAFAASARGPTRCSGTSSPETSLARHYANAAARLALEVGVRCAHPALLRLVVSPASRKPTPPGVPDARTAHPLAPNHDGAPIASGGDPVQISG